MYAKTSVLLLKKTSLEEQSLNEVGFKEVILAKKSLAKTKEGEKTLELSSLRKENVDGKTLEEVCCVGW